MKWGSGIFCATVGLSGCTLLESLDGFTGGSVDAGADAGTSVLDASSEAGTDAEAGVVLCGGKDCLGGACVANVCRPGVLAAGQTRARGLALFDDEIYWVTDTGNVMRVSKRGGAPKMLAATGGKLVSIAVDGSGVFFTNESAGKVSKVPNDGGAVVDLSTGETSPWGIALDGTHAYYSTSTMIRRVLQTGGAASQLFRGGLATPRKVVIGNGRVYWLYETATGADPTVESMELGGGFPPQCHFNNQISPHGLAVDSTSIYHTLHLAAPGGAIRRKMLAETCATNAKVIGGPVAWPFELALDATNVYWTVDQPNGSIVALDKLDMSAQPRELATGQSSPWGIVVDASNGTLYWTNGGEDGAVMVLVR